MPTSLLKKLIKQFSMYFSSSLLTMMAGFLTYPIWTRVFSKAEYGRMSLATVTLALFVAFSKFGIQHAALRFYSEFKEHKRYLDIKYYYTTSFLSVFAISFVISVILFLFVEFYHGFQMEPQYLEILRILPSLIVFDAINSIFLLFLQAEQNVKLRTIFIICRRYLRVFSTLLFVLVFKLGLTGFFIGWALIDFLFSIILIVTFIRMEKLALKCFSISLFRESLSYGLPLIGFELSSLLLASGDRFFVQYFMDAAAVGVYSSSYNLTSYIVDFFAAPFRMTIMPLFMSIWEKKGKKETQHFLSSMLKAYFMVGVPIIFAVSFIGRDLLVLLASKKFEEGYIIMPYIVTGLVVFKANSLYAAGLYLKKKTVTLLIVQFGAALLNILLNLLLIPQLGIVGAAIATLVAYICQVIFVMNLSFRTVSVNIPFYHLIKYTAISMIMVVVMLSINIPGATQIFVRIIAGLITYGCGIL